MRAGTLQENISRRKKQTQNHTIPTTTERKRKNQTKTTKNKLYTNGHKPIHEQHNKTRLRKWRQHKSHKTKIYNEMLPTKSFRNNENKCRNR